MTIQNIFNGDVKILDFNASGPRVTSDSYSKNDSILIQSRYTGWANENLKSKERYTKGRRKNKILSCDGRRDFNRITISNANESKPNKKGQASRNFTHNHSTLHPEDWSNTHKASQETIPFDAMRPNFTQQNESIEQVKNIELTFTPPTPPPPPPQFNIGEISLNEKDYKMMKKDRFLTKKNSFMAMSEMRQVL